MNYKINKYPDGTSYVVIPEEWSDTTQIITFKLKDYESLWHLVQLCEALTYNNVETLIKIPHLIDSQADRRFNTYHSSGLYTIAETLNSYENIHFEIFHPHNPSVVEALFERVNCTNNSEFIKKVLFKLPGLNSEIEKNTILMSPDAGAFKSLINTCQDINWKGETFSCAKNRGTVKDVDGKYPLKQFVGKDDFEGKDILIVDDICVYGGTFKGLSKLLKERNCGKLYLAVSHMTVQNLGEDPVTNYFDKVFVTNSKFDNYSSTFTGRINNLEVIKMF